MHRTIIIGSPRERGRSAHLAEELFEACVEECPEDSISLIAAADMGIHPCIGCDGCKEALSKEDDRYPELPEKGEELSQHPLIYKSTANEHQCIYEDGMKEVRMHLDASDELIIVCPVYFASVPSQMKALLDRLQPYFWSDVRTRSAQRRPCTIHIVGEGGDPVGFAPLIGTIRSSCGVAGFSLERVMDWVGCIEEDGTIIANGREVMVDE